ncbi:hypothetical protein [Pseudomonas fluorescens]|uniref:DUF4347 domain-containing protein n=1 Tax=Pseudomonas fluorescens TaxID=294 RepID=A0A423MCP5_PSEFL|nr:hypothetical protein [Pseudomonas fluorescens]RON81067.1 hypothetical protein BK670_12855 [Pseudomonas fluorescens]
MICWNAVVERKVKAGVVIKNMLDGSEALIPFTTLKLAVLDPVNKITDWLIGTPWVAETEKESVVVGRALIVFFKQNEEKLVPAYAAFRGDFKFRIDEEEFVDPYQREIVVIYHDFSEETKKGNSGSAFAKGVESYVETFSGVSHLVHADGTYEELVVKLTSVAEVADGWIDTVLIVTHGYIGQMWLGNADEIFVKRNFAAVLGRSESGKDFINPESFGVLLKNLFGPKLGIGIYACNFACSPGGDEVAIAIRGAAEARVVVAGKADVFLKPNSKGHRPVAECKGAVAFYSEHEIEIRGGQVPVFPI